MKNVVLVAGIIIIGFLVFNSMENQRCYGCNIILISMDTLGAKHLNKNTAPNITRLASDGGIIFSEAFSQSSWTLPSHASMLTGEFYEWNTIQHSLPENEYTLAEALLGKGYTTHAFSTGPFVQKEWGLAQGFQSFSGSFSTEDNWNDLPALFENSLEWIIDYKKEQPFFLFVHSFHVHDPFKGVNSKEIGTANQKDDANLEYFLNPYHEEIREFDDAFFNLYTQLEQRGFLKNTIIVLTSDHGEEFGEHGSVALHGVTTYREVLHVPLIVFTPQKKSSIVEFSVGVNQIPATIFDVLGFGKFSTATSLLKVKKDELVRSATSNQKDQLLAAYIDRKALIQETLNVFSKKNEFRFEELGEPNTFQTQSVILGKWHLIKNPDETFELFNMREDQNEELNLFEEQDTLLPKDKEAVEELYQLLHI